VSRIGIYNSKTDRYIDSKSFGRKYIIRRNSVLYWKGNQFCTW